MIIVGICLFCLIDVILYIKSPFPGRISWYGYLPGGGIVTYFLLKK